MCYIIVFLFVCFLTCDAVPLQVNPLQCGYFSQHIREAGEAVICQIDAG